MNPFPSIRTRVKICGLTRGEDALAAAGAGADALGLVFYSSSPRHVSLEQAAAIAAVVPPFVSIVGLFVDPDQDYVREVLRRVPLDLLQFHGSESATFCQQFDKRYIKALAVRTTQALRARVMAYADATAVLLDAFKPGVPGGTGESFDWGLVPDDLPLPFILAGGLDASCVESAIRQLSPWALDVSSGVESGKGVKDAGKIIEFIKEVRRADNQ